jgi:hypothetical protein
MSCSNLTIPLYPVPALILHGLKTFLFTTPSAMKVVPSVLKWATTAAPVSSDGIYKAPFVLSMDSAILHVSIALKMDSPPSAHPAYHSNLKWCTFP